MRRITLVLLFVGLIAGLVDCGGGGGGGGAPPPAAVSISILPTKASVDAGAKEQFAATVQNATTTSVTWQVNGVGGGNTTVGAIDTGGNYVAPSTVPNPATVTVTAIAQADSTKSASAQVTITAPITVSVKPATATIAVGASQQFQATLQNASDETVVWQVDGKAGGDSTAGIITSAGLYTAPANPPTGGTVTITAVSNQDTSKTGSATLTITLSNATLNGQYAFVVSSSTLLGQFFAAGTFTADGNGNLAAAVADVNNLNGVSTNVSATGSYLLGADGRGTLTLKDSSNGNTLEFALAMVNNTQGTIVNFDANQDVAAGVLYKQDSSAFNNASIKGGYAFRLAGWNEDGSGLLNVAGVLSADGNGKLTGTEDINDNLSVESDASLTGTYAVGANGRGTATFTNTGSGSLTFNLAFYVVSAGKLLWISTDQLPALAGTAELQSQSSFTNASLNGDFVFTQLGMSQNGNFGAVGRFHADGNGAITGGIVDSNDEGVPDNQSFTGTYKVSANGRTDVTFTIGAGLELYLVSPSRGFLVETDTIAATGGVVDQETGGPFASSSLKGSFTFQMTGEGAAGEAAASGTLTADGNSNLSGSEDLNDGGSFGGLAPEPNLPATGTYSLTADRGTAKISAQGSSINTSLGGPQNFVVYAISKSSYRLLEIDNGGPVIAGSLWQQF